MLLACPIETKRCLHTTPLDVMGIENGECECHSSSNVFKYSQLNMVDILETEADETHKKSAQTTILDGW